MWFKRRRLYATASFALAAAVLFGASASAHGETAVSSGTVASANQDVEGVSFSHPKLESVGRSTMSFGFEDVTNSGLDLAAVDAQLDAMQVDTVALSAGRADWSSFAWDGHAHRQAPVVQRTINKTGQAPFDRAVAELGQDREVVAVVDVFLGRYLLDHPDAAAVNGAGEASTFQVSIAELTQGAHGDALIEMVRTLAARGDVSAVTLTELQYDQHGFGESDLALYRADTGENDWPRDRRGRIKWRDKRVAQWRSERVAGFVERARDAANEHGVDLLVDVRSPRDGGTAVYGQDYGKLYDASDGLVIWYYPGLNGDGDGSGWTLPRIVNYLRVDEGIDEERVVLSVGLWANGGTLPADRLGSSLRQAETAGFTHLWVTPYSLMGDEHVAALTDSLPPVG